MALSPATSRGGVSLPLSAVSVPAGTQLVIDAAGSLTLTGTNGNGGEIIVAESPASGQAVLSSGAGVYATDPATGGIAQLVTTGYVLFNAHAAPADVGISNGHGYLWFDQANGVGNTKLMVKAKSADGTVKTATIVLA